MDPKKSEENQQGALRIIMNKEATTAVKYLKDYLQEHSYYTTTVQNYNVTVYLIRQIFQFILMAGVCTIIAVLAFNKILEGGPLIGVIGTIVGYIFGQGTKNNQ